MEATVAWVAIGSCQVTIRDCSAPRSRAADPSAFPTRLSWEICIGYLRVNRTVYMRPPKTTGNLTSCKPDSVFCKNGHTDHGKKQTRRTRCSGAHQASRRQAVLPSRDPCDRRRTRRTTGQRIKTDSLPTLRQQERPGGELPSCDRRPRRLTNGTTPRQRRPPG